MASQGDQNKNKRCDDALHDEQNDKTMKENSLFYHKRQGEK